MYPTDARSTWPADLLVDRRVSHRWDEGKLMGRWYWGQLSRIWPRKALESREPGGGTLWDAYLLYRPEATWEDSAAHLVSWGYPIVRSGDALLRDFDRLAGEIKPGSR